MSAAEPYVTKGGVEKNPGSHGITWDYLLGKPGETGFSSKSTAEQVSAGWDGRGVVALVTGAATGLGYESARVLALRGAHVVVAVRSQVRAEATASRLRRDVPGAAVTPLELDLASLTSVRSAAAAYLRTGLPLHILMLNAGVMACPPARTRDGFELQWGTNHLGHFALTQQLLDVMIASCGGGDGGGGVPREGRVVVLSSMGHHLFQVPGGVDFEALTSCAGYVPFKAYGVSKLSNILFARELQRRLTGKPVVAVCCHPGVILDTELSKYMNGTAPAPAAGPGSAAAGGGAAAAAGPESGRAWSQWLHGVGMSLTALLFRPVAKSVPQGAATQVFLATSPRVAGGEYYSDCNLAPSSAASHDGELGARLWSFSEEAVRKKRGEGERGEGEGAK